MTAPAAHDPTFCVLCLSRDPTHLRQVGARDLTAGDPAPAAGTVRLWVAGTPVQQGSKKLMPIYAGSKAKGTRRPTGRSVMVEDAADDLKPWRKEITKVAKRTYRDREPLVGAVSAAMFFAVPRGKSVTRPYPSVRPDISKYVRAVEDSLTDAGVWEDDGQATRYHGLAKVYAGGPWFDGMPELTETGVWVELIPLEPQPVRRRVAPRQGRPDPRDLERLRDGRLAAGTARMELFGDTGAA